MSKEFVDVHNLIVATAQHYHFPAPPKLILLVQEILTSLLRTLLTLLAALLSILPGYTDTRAASDFIKVGLYAMGLVGAFLFIWLLWTRLHELGKQANLAKAGGLASEGSFTAAAWQEQALAFCRAKRWKDACRAMLLASIRLLDE